MLIKKLGELLVENRLVTPEQLEEALREQELRTREFKLLRSISRKISAGMPLEELLAAVAEESRSLLDVDTVKIYIREEDRDVFLLRYPDPRYQTEEVLAGPDDPLVAALLDEKTVRLYGDLAAETAGRETFIRHEARAAALVPFLDMDSVVGFMLLTHRGPFAVQEDEAALLQVVGAQVGIPIQQSKYLTSRSRIGDFLLKQGRIEPGHLTDALNEQQNALNKLTLLRKFNQALVTARRLENVLELVADAVCRTLDVRTLAVFLADTEAERYYSAYERGIERIVGGAFEFPFDHPLFQQLENWLDPVVVLNPAEYPDLADHPMMSAAACVVALPVPAVKRLAGAVFALLPERREIDATEIDLASVFAAQAGILVDCHHVVQEKNRLGYVLLRRGAISKEQLDEVLKDQEAYTSIADYLRATSRRISRMDTVDEMLEAVADEAAKLLKNDNVILYLGDRELKQFVRILDWALEGDPEKPPNAGADGESRGADMIPFDAPLAKKLFQKHDAVLCDDVPGSPDFHGVFTGGQVRSCVVLPFLAKNIVVGMLLAVGEGPTESMKENLPLLFTLLSDVGIAIETMRISAEKHKLGRILVDQGAISDESLKHALKKQRE